MAGPADRCLPSAFSLHATPGLLLPNLAPAFLRPGVRVTPTDLSELARVLTPRLVGPYAAKAAYFCVPEAQGCYDLRNADDAARRAGFRAVTTGNLARSHGAMWHGAPRAMPELPPGFAVEVGAIRDGTFMSRAMRIAQEQFDIPMDLARMLRTAELAHAGPAYAVVVRSPDGEDVATGSVFVTGESALLAAGAVRPRWRGLGIWRALLAARQRVSYDHGARYWALNTSNPRLVGRGDLNFKLTTYLAEARCVTG